MAFSKAELQEAIQKESKKFEEFYLWLQQHMPPKFFDEVGRENLMLIAHNLMSLDQQNYFSQIHLKDGAIVLCLQSEEATLRILEKYRSYEISHYRTFVSDAPPPFPSLKAPLRVGILSFAGADKKTAISETELHALIEESNPRFFKAMTNERLQMAMNVLKQAQTSDQCEIEVRANKDWKEHKDMPSLQLVLAWRDVPKYDFLYKMAKIIYRHGLSLRKINAIYIQQNTLLISLGLNGKKGGAAWDEADIDDLLQEITFLKLDVGHTKIENVFVEGKLQSGNLGLVIKTLADITHQLLVHADPNMYNMINVEEALCRHPELTQHLPKLFEAKFHPKKQNFKEFKKGREEFLALVEELDTGNETNDRRRKNILRVALSFIDNTLKTNFYTHAPSALSFRLDPQILDQLPYDRKEKFPALPFAIFFMKGWHFIGFHIRFVDLARGGLRTVIPQKLEQYATEQNNVFAECYNLAYTQQKKNKDIPEGGAKGVILLEPFEGDNKEEKLQYLYAAQRCYIESFMTLINCAADGKLKAENIIDYWKKPEYIYLGPDENLHNEMIVWISNYSRAQGYKSGSSFMSSKPGAGINHKEFGVTSYGVNTYMEEMLKYLNRDPKKDPFTIKMSGGPDGDVAGNQIYNLYQFYPKTAKLLALIDVSGTLYDPEGLDLTIMADLFKESKPLRFYPKEKLHDGGYLLDLFSKREETAYAQKTLWSQKKEGKIVEEWISGNEMNHLLRFTVHKTRADIFIPGGGRPRTLNDNNYKDFLDETGKPTSLAIIEGANLYLTPWARRSLEKLGVLIIKDSSANKGGVICSSFEVLAGLCLSEEEFLKEKPTYVKEILEIIRQRCEDEAKVLLDTHTKTKAFLTDISEMISEKINTYTYQLLDYLQTQTLSSDPKDPLIRCLLNYCPPTLRDKYPERVLTEVPDIHKKAIIACYLASRLVYTRGVDWSPTLVDILPLIDVDETIIGR